MKLDELTKTEAWKLAKQAEWLLDKYTSQMYSGVIKGIDGIFLTATRTPNLNFYFIVSSADNRSVVAFRDESNLAKRVYEFAFNQQNENRYALGKADRCELVMKIREYLKGGK